MKLLLKLFTTIFGTLTIAALGIYFLLFGPSERDQLNPFLDYESRYFIVKEDGEPYGPEGYERYQYDVQTYNEQLEPQTLLVTAAINLRHDAIIEVTAKGQHVETWKEVQPTEVHADVLQKISND